MMLLHKHIKKKLSVLVEDNSRIDVLCVATSDNLQRRGRLNLDPR